MQAKVCTYVGHFRHQTRQGVYIDRSLDMRWTEDKYRNIREIMDKKRYCLSLWVFVPKALNLWNKYYTFAPSLFISFNSSIYIPTINNNKTNSPDTITAATTTKKKMILGEELVICILRFKNSYTCKANIYMIFNPRDTDYLFLTRGTRQHSALYRLIIRRLALRRRSITFTLHHWNWLVNDNP